MVSAGSVESLDRASNVSERVEVKRKIAIKHHSYSMSSSNRSNTPTGKFSDNCKLTKKKLLIFARAMYIKCVAIKSSTTTTITRLYDA